MSEQSELVEVLARVHNLEVQHAEALAREALGLLEGPRRNRWQLVCVKDVSVKQKIVPKVAPVLKTDFRSLLAVFAAGMWVGYVNPSTGEVDVIVYDPKAQNPPRG